MEYQVPVYTSDMVALIARLVVETVHWVGTSMGGLIGMTLTALPGSPVKKLVLNDVGPELAAVSLARIGAYVGKWPPLPTIEAAEAHMRTVSAPFGPHSEAVSFRRLDRRNGPCIQDGRVPRFPHPARQVHDNTVVVRCAARLDERKVR